MDKNKKDNSLLIESNSPITIAKWDEIVRTIIMFSDSVWMHVPFEISNRMEESARSHINIVLNELRENHLVRFYALDSDADHLKSVSERVVTREEHMQLYNSIIERVNNTDRLYVDGLNDPERTSRIIECRNELWKFGVADILNADVSASYKTRKNVSYMNQKMGEMCINADVAKELFSIFHVQSMAHLGTQEILNFRKDGEKYRDSVKLMCMQAKDKSPDETSEFVKTEYEKYIISLNELAMTAAGSKAIQRMAKNTVFNVIGLFIPIMAGLMCGMDYYSYFKDRKKYGFVLFMNSLASRKK